MRALYSFNFAIYIIPANNDVFSYGSSETKIINLKPFLESAGNLTDLKSVVQTF